MSPAIAPVFFQRHDIALAPSEIYEAKVEIIASVNEVLDTNLSLQATACTVASRTA
jgi:hypothetical protein